MRADGAATNGRTGALDAPKPTTEVSPANETDEQLGKLATSVDKLKDRLIVTWAINAASASCRSVISAETSIPTREPGSEVEK